MKSDTQPSAVFLTEDRIQVCVYGEGETREVADRIVPQLQALVQQGIEFARGCLREP